MVIPRGLPPASYRKVSAEITRMSDLRLVFTSMAATAFEHDSALQPLV